MSQAALSEKSGISIPQIKNIESGKNTPHDSTLELLSEALNVSVNYLKYGKE
jgi:transcriptional regulator with XRE-family HTH domain